VTFHEARHLLGASFAGTREVKGEPTVSHWLLPPLKLSEKENIEIVTFFMSFVVAGNQAKKSKFFTKSVANDKEHASLVGSVIVKESDPQHQESWLQKALDKSRDLFVTYRLLLQGGVPDFFQSKDHKDNATKLEQCFGQWGKQAKAAHLEFGPSSKHWYVHVVGTHPAFQKQGHGSDLMTRISQLADEAQMECFLEASQDNVEWYQKFGFKLVGTYEMVNPFDKSIPNSILYCMVRPVTAA